MGQYAAAHQKHRYRARHRQAFHQPGCCPQNRAADRALKTWPAIVARLIVEPQTAVVELDDASHQPVNTHRHDQRDGAQHRELGDKGAALHGTQRDGDDLCRQNKVGANSALDPGFFQRRNINRRGS